MADRTDYLAGDWADPPRPTRRLTLVAVKTAVSVVLLAILFSRVDVGSLWTGAATASPAWLLAALGLYAVNIVASTWRWRLLLDAQGVHVPARRLLSSYLVAGFFNNFLPSNIGGDVVRIRDTARHAGSKTLATTVVLADRALGLFALVLVAALGATSAGAEGSLPIWPVWLWTGFLVSVVAAVAVVGAPSGVGRLLQSLTFLHPEWIGERIGTFTGALARFRERPRALAACFTAAVLVQAVLVGYYLAVVYALHMPVPVGDLAVIVPVSFVLQMLPISVNGFGVREATFAFYFTRVGLPIEAALLLSLTAASLMMLCSLAGAAVYISRDRAQPQAGRPRPASDATSR